MTESVFLAKSPKIIADLMARYDLADFQAAGVLGNIGHECAGFTELQENRPVSGLGGLGWCMWTGPRRRQFTGFCEAWGAHYDSDAANWRMLCFDLDHDYRSTISALLKARDLHAAVAAFERNYERAGVVAMNERYHWGLLALNQFRKVHGAAEAHARNQENPHT